MHIQEIYNKFGGLLILLSCIGFILSGFFYYNFYISLAILAIPSAVVTSLATYLGDTFIPLRKGKIATSVAIGIVTLFIISVVPLIIFFNG